MTSTTIKVSTELRDRLKQQASAHDRTIGEHLAALLAEDARRERFVELRRRMAETPPDLQYDQEAKRWQADRWS